MEANQTHLSKRSKRMELAGAIIIVAIGYLAVRLPLWGNDPQVYVDAWGYIEPALTMLGGDFSISGWQSERGPTYPVFLWLIFLLFGESNLSAVINVQAILGAFITALLFLLGWKISGSRLIATLASLSYALNVSAALYEISILSETLATLLAVCAVGLGAKLIRLAWNGSSLRRFLILSIMEGLICVLLALCKHMFAAYSLVPTLFIVAAGVARSISNDRGRLHPGALRLIITSFIVAISAAAVIFWSLGNYINYGWFTFSTLSGFNMSNIAGGFIEESGEEGCEDYIDLYVRYRQQEIERKNTHAMTLARAWMERIDPTDIDARVTYERLAYKCSLSAILARPDLYLLTARKSSDLFWNPAVYRRGALLPASKIIADRLGTILQILKILFTLALLLWLIFPYFIFRFGKKEKPTLWRMWLEAGLVLFTVLYALIVSSATEYGENRRYKAPIEPLITFSILQVGVIYARVMHHPRRNPL